MKQVLFICGLSFFLTIYIFGQEIKPASRTWEISISVQFHALSTPFKHFKNNLKNLGLGLHVRTPYAGDGLWAQKFSTIWYRNQAVGNGVVFSTQASYRTGRNNQLWGEINMGLGYAVVFRPSDSFIWKNKTWQPTGKKGKGMLTLPLGVNMGRRVSDNFSPYIGYEFAILNGYNESIPIMPMRFLSVGNSWINN